MHSRNISRHLETDYGVSLAGAKRLKITDMFASRFDQSLFPEDEKGHGSHEDAAQDEIYAMQLQSRQRRDMAFDFYNPRQNLPNDLTSERIIDEIPDFKPQVIDLALPEDYKARDQVNLVQDARANFIAQSNMYDEPGFHSSGEGRGQHGLSPAEAYSLGGSAAGLQTNHMLDEDGTPENSVESVQAF